MNTAFKIHFGEGEAAFRKSGKRFKDTKIIEDNLDQYHVLTLQPQNNIIGVCRTKMKNNSKRVEISHLAIDPLFQVCSNKS